MLEQALDLDHAEDEELVRALRAGDEEAFIGLVHRHHRLMVRIALGYVRTEAVAEEVVQETWCAVLHGIDRFEGRAALKTWIMRILVNRAKTRGQREARCMPFSAIADGDHEGPAVDPSRFLPADHPRYPNHWAAAPSEWSRTPDEQLLAAETRECIRSAIAGLPARQRLVISLRDVEGWSPEEVCKLMGVTENNQRVILHRARSHVRAELESYLTDDSQVAA
jgi:RNA polymerase sigma-70 factor, ECF subfamily